ncbi:hypothetical protein LCGC14_1788970 [marine sediment metagenome]|uniref:Uncharacterized protein n=1 Tax=marine sediment metagenome TaxID=412755 RepID=A0A0F9J802_9ZZZZ
MNDLLEAARAVVKENAKNLDPNYYPWRDLGIPMVPLPIDQKYLTALSEAVEERRS